MKKLHLFARNSVLFFSALVILFTTSCTKYTFMPMEEKVVGRWSFEKVRYYHGFMDLTADNITHEYRDWVYEFRENGAFTMSNERTGELYRGSWFMESYTDDYSYFDDEGNYISNTQTSYELTFDAYNASINSWERYTWIVSINSRRLRGTETYNNERWEYKMQRL